MRYLPLLLIPLAAFAAPAKNVDLDDYIEGKVIAGQAYTDLTLKNKPMIICMWKGAGIWRPETVFQRMAIIMEGKDGKIVPVAVEVTGMTGPTARKYTEEMASLVKNLDVKYTVIMGPRKSSQQRPQLLPFCYILDAKKAQLYAGQLGGNPEFDLALKRAIESGEKTDAKDPKK